VIEHRKKHKKIPQTKKIKYTKVYKLGDNKKRERKKQKKERMRAGSATHLRRLWRGQ
jgi:hypothetical protein